MYYKGPFLEEFGFLIVSSAVHKEHHASVTCFDYCTLLICSELIKITECLHSPETRMKVSYYYGRLEGTSKSPAASFRLLIHEKLSIILLNHHSL